MKRAFRILMCFMAASAVHADYRHVDFDAKRDFSIFKTFIVSDGNITTNAPEMDSWFTRKKIVDTIHAQLTAKGLTNVQNRPDATVSWELGAMNGRGVEQEIVNARGNVRAKGYEYKEVILTIELKDINSRSIWRGVYRDDDRNPSKLADNLPQNIKKLFADFPPRKK